MHLDAEWAQLTANNPDTVMAALAIASEDNDAAAAPLGVAGDKATLVVIVPSLTGMPQKEPDITPMAGRLSKQARRRRPRPGMRPRLDASSSR
ncbi:hypothetical protein [Curtobacterium luteum]|uniref:hypothetical protein n=1 Tax=Curtobacterium luteum TaxID=33881 RepID=UPI00381E49B1